jgi:serine/threonine-protein kinase
MTQTTPPGPIILNGRYQLLERVGNGGMAAVYRAHDLVLGRAVAVKLLHSMLIGDAAFLESFKREAHAAANLSHPNIVTVHDIGQDGDRHYIVMEFVDGFTLKQVIREQGENRPVPTDRAVALTIQTCAGLGYAHRAGLVHCDMKPQNVLVTRDERVKVTDFGIARAVSEATSQSRDLVWGTPQYFSPEQAMGEAATPASDVYSVGVMLYEMLTGQLPFSAENPRGFAWKHLHEEPTPVSQHNPAIPAHLEEIVHKVLSKNPDSRYRTAGQFGRILATWYQQRGEATGVSGTPSMPRPPATPAVSAPVAATPSLVDENTHPPSPAIMRPVPAGTPRPAIRPATPRPATLPPADPLPTPVEEAATPWPTLVLGALAVIAWLGLLPLWVAVARLWGIF